MYYYFLYFEILFYLLLIFGKEIEFSGFVDTIRDKKWFQFIILRDETGLVQYMREYLYNNDFTEIHTPKFIGAASESGSEVFEVKKV